jgi:NAD(P)-dependent dehydrogenase (short-subunit alcohol dehydrogenase family)
MAGISPAMRKVLITGASSDIGLAVCRRFLEDDYTIVAHFNSGRPELTELATNWPDRVRLVGCDFSEPDAVDRLCKKHPAEIDGADILINAAAIYEPLTFMDLTADAILAGITANLLPGLLLMKQCVPGMLERGFGRIVHLSSIGVKFQGGSNSFVYSLTKHALEFLPADHKKWAAHNVFVNSIRVGLTDTRFHNHNPSKNMADRIALVPAGRMASPEEIARQIYWLGSPENSFTTGQTISVSGGE